MKPLAAALLLLAALGSEQPEPAPPPTRLFAIVFRTGPAWDKARPPAQQSFMKEHSQNLAALRKAEKIALGGRFGELGLVVVRAADLAEARAMLDGDPAVAAGVFQADVQPWSTIYEGCTGANPSPPPR
jgi:uncharacterized protein YciI